jgi:hypothetical protein
MAPLQREKRTAAVLAPHGHTAKFQPKQKQKKTTP